MLQVFNPIEEYMKAHNVTAAQVAEAMNMSECEFEREMRSLRGFKNPEKEARFHAVIDQIAADQK